MKPTTVILVIALVAITLFASGCLTNPTGSTVVDPNDQCTALEGGAKDNCYLEAGKCSKITGTSLRDICVVELAKKKNDITVCNLVASAQPQGNCQNHFSQVMEDPTICDVIYDIYWKDICYFNHAQRTHDPQFC